MPTRTLLALFASALLACGGSTPRSETPAEHRTLTEGEALAVILQSLEEQHVEIERDVPVDIGHGDPLVVDVRFAGRSFGIEWVSHQDRADEGDRLPMPAPGGQLRILPGANAQADFEVLLLEQSTYEYVSHAEHVQRGAIGHREVDGRVRRDVRDFVEYVRGHATP